MKKYILLLLFPIVSFAGTVQVNHTVQNVQGIGKLDSSAMSSIITYSNNSIMKDGNGSFQLYDLSDSNKELTDYSVSAPFIPHYEYTLAGDCNSSVLTNRVKICFIQWSDTGPSVNPVVNVNTGSAPAVEEIQVASSEAARIESLQLQLIQLLTQLVSLLNQLNARASV